MFGKDNTIITELQEISPILAGYSKSMPYELPDRNWFKDFTEQMNERKSILAGKEEIYVLPDHYFTAFADQVLTLIRKSEVEQEIHEISPLLSQIERKLPYTEPVVSAYNIATSQIKKKEISPVVVQLFSARFVRVAAAACVLAALLTFVIKFMLNKETGNEQVQVPVILSEKEYDELLATVDDESIIDYLHKEGISLNQSDLESMVESDALPEEIEYYDPELSDEFFRSIEDEMMSDSTINLK